jgi:hypothetical protein
MQKISIREGHTERGCWRVVSQDQVSVFGHNARTPDMWATRHDAIFRRVVTLLGSYYHRTKTVRGMWSRTSVQDITETPI